MKPTPAAEEPPARKTFDEGAGDGMGDSGEAAGDGGTGAEFPDLPADGDSNFRPTRPREGEGEGSGERTEAFKPTVEDDADSGQRSPAPTGESKDEVSPNKLPAPPKAEDANGGSTNSSENSAASFSPQLRLTIHRRPARSRLPIQSVKGRIHVAERSDDVNSEWLPAPVRKPRAASIAAR